MIAASIGVHLRGRNGAELKGYVGRTGGLVGVPVLDSRRIAAKQPHGGNGKVVEVITQNNK